MRISKVSVSYQVFLGRVLMLRVGTTPRASSHHFECFMVTTMTWLTLQGNKTARQAIHYTENKKLGNINPTKTKGIMYVLRKGNQFLLN
jgi:hypothetical protein